MAYSVEIISAKKELTKKERIQIKDMSYVTKLDSATQEGDFEIDVVANIVELKIHNDKANPTDYTNIVIIDGDGNRYATGSASFTRSLKNIDEEMGDEEYGIICFRRPSQNYKGKDFLSCSLA